MDKSFKKGCVLIVGGSGGIGSLCAKEFAQSGARVVITYYKNEQAAIDVANNINNDVQIYQLDNSDSKSVEETFQKVVNDYESINTLVNAAGFDIPQKFVSEIDIDLTLIPINEKILFSGITVPASLPVSDPSLSITKVFRWPSQYI